MPDATSPIRIAFCVTDLDPGGAERALVQLVTRLDRHRFNPAVICLSSPGVLVEKLEAANVPVKCLGARRWWDMRLLWRLSAELKRLRPQILQTFLFHANVTGRLAAWWCGVPHVFSGIRVAERRRNLHLQLDRWTESLVDRHVCVSQSVADYSRDVAHLSARKLCVIPNGVDAERFVSATPLDLRPWNIQADDDVWVTVGRLDPQKGPWILFEALQKLLLTHPRLKLLWAGQGPLKDEMQRWIDDRKLADSIHLIGWQDNIAGLLRAAQGFVLASQWEGMPNVILEAQAAGLPVISTAAEGVAEIILPGETGWIVPVGNAAELARCWDDALNNRDLTQRIAAAGQQRVQQHFTWDTMAERYMAIYRDCVGH